MFLHRPLTRRTLLGAALTLPWQPRLVIAGPDASLVLRARPDTLRLRTGGAATPVAAFEAGGDTPARLLRRDTVQAIFVNDLPVAARLDWRGIDGAIPGELLSPGERISFALPAPQAGTFLCSIVPMADLPPAALAVVVEEPDADTTPALIDRDEVLLIEEWRLGAGDQAIPPGHDPGSAETIFTVNRARAAAIAAASNSRLIFRFINGSQRTVIAIRIPDVDIRVRAIDSRPAEPFIAGNSQFVLPPGGRLDAQIDVTLTPGAGTPILLHDGSRLHTIGRLTVASGEPLRPAPLPAPAAHPADGLPERLDLARARRFTLDLAPDPAGEPPAVPAFSLKRGHTAVLALKNDGPKPVAVRLSGHHARLLDRLDDGWKPFWLDTLLVPPRTTERIALRAEHAGRFPIETTALAWDAQRRIRWYAVA